MTSTQTAPTRAADHHVGRAIQGLLVSCTGFVALTAILGGVLLVARPDGAAMGLTTEWLEGSVFPDYLVPGLALVAVGVLNALAAWGVGHNWRSGWILAVAAGTTLAIYEMAEWAAVGYHWLQTLYFTLGVVTAVVGLIIVPPRG